MVTDLLGEERQIVSSFLRYASYSILTFQVYDWLSSLSFEIEHIWRGSLTLVKSQYYYSRYFGLVIQLIQVFVFNQLYHLDSSSSVPRTTCHLWFFFQMAGSQTLLLSLELTAIHRLYVIYEQNDQLLLLLGSLVGGEAIVNFALQFTYVPQVETTGICVPRHFPLPIAFVPIIQAGTQVTIWFLTFRRAGGFHIPILSLIVRDGSRTLVALLFLLSAVASQVILNSFEVVRPQLSPLLFPIFVLVVSLATCKMIENMEKMARQAICDERDSTGSIPLMSFRSVSEEESIPEG